MQQIKGHKPWVGELIVFVIAAGATIWSIVIHDISLYFWLMLSLTIISGISAFVNLRQSIRVGDDGVVVSGILFTKKPKPNGTEESGTITTKETLIAYADILDTTASRRRITVDKTDGTRVRVIAQNAYSVRDVILANKAAAAKSATSATSEKTIEMQAETVIETENEAVV